MSRHGYSDDYDDLALGRWRGQVASAIRGERGQRLLKDLVEALDAMPVKKLIKEELKTADGQYCALGALGAKRGLDLNLIDPEDSEMVAKQFDIAEQLAREIVYENDECCFGTPEERWKSMRDWAQSKIRVRG